VDRIVFPTAALVIPIAIAFATNDLSKLVGITGSYAGVGIQYVVPGCFALLARRSVTAAASQAAVSGEEDTIGGANEDEGRVTVYEVGPRPSEGVVTVSAYVKNEYESPFRHTAWIVAVFSWAVICIAFVTANHIIEGA